MDGYRQLHDLLRRWRLSAAAYSAPGFEERLQAVQEAVRTGSLDGVGADRGDRARLAGSLVSYRVRFEGAALVQLNGLPSAAFDALLHRAVDLAEEPWDATVMPPGKEPASS